MANLHCLLNKNVDEINAEISRIVHESESFDMIYISIGGKINEPYVEFRSPDKVKGKNYRTNSIYQMYPRFLENRSPNCKILVIAVDNFKDRFLYERNKEDVKDLLDDNVTFIMANYQFVQTTLTTFISNITRIAKNNEVAKENFMICNYVKHLNEPNIREFRDEEMIPRTIQDVLNTTEFIEYTECFYDWFGYRFYLYNFLYKYKYNSILMGITRVVPDLESIVEGQIQNNSKDIMVVQNTPILRFLDNVYDITSNARKDSTKMTGSLKQYLLDHDQLVYKDSQPDHIHESLGVVTF